VRAAPHRHVTESEEIEMRDITERGVVVGRRKGDRR
jgi:hypothetical protein